MYKHNGMEYEQTEDGFILHLQDGPRHFKSKRALLGTIDRIRLATQIPEKAELKKAKRPSVRKVKKVVKEDNQQAV